MRVAIAFAAALSFGTAAGAAPAPEDWLKKPTGAEVAETYPFEAQIKGLQGRAVIKCKIKDDGHLRDCTVLTALPKNVGFEKSALTLGKIFQLRPTLAGGSVTIPITWRLQRPADPFPSVKVELPPWTATPSQSDIAEAFPLGATGKIDSGTVKMSCSVTLDGMLNPCEVTAAEPSGLGFEEAAIKLTRKFAVDLEWRLGLDADVTAEFPIQIAEAGSPVWKERPMGKVNWLQTADLEMAQSVFPPAAIKAGVSSGSALVNCVVIKSGALTNCTPESESPTGMGFGQAVSEVAQHYIMSPWTSAGLALVARSGIRKPARAEVRSQA